MYILCYNGINILIARRKILDYKAEVLQSDSRSTRAAQFAEILFRLILIIFAVLDLILDDFLQVHQASVFYHAMVTLAISFIPDILKKTTRLKIIPEFRYLFLAFVFISQFMGEIFDFFIKYSWWDKMAHVISAFIITIIGYIILYFYLPPEEYARNNKTYLVFATIFAFSFSMMLGAMWEIFEYFMDVTFGHNMQKSGLTDTMGDFLACLAGSLMPCILFLTDIKRKKKSFVTALINKYLEISKRPD
jgi:hypothetical protein